MVYRKIDGLWNADGHGCRLCYLVNSGIFHFCHASCYLNTHISFKQTCMARLRGGEFHFGHIFSFSQCLHCIQKRCMWFVELSVFGVVFITFKQSCKGWAIGADGNLWLIIHFGLSQDVDSACMSGRLVIDIFWKCLENNSNFKYPIEYYVGFLIKTFNIFNH